MPNRGTKPVMASRGSWLAHVAIFSRLAPLSKPSHPHPDPWTAMADVDNFSCIASTDPKSLLMASNRAPSGTPESFSGHKTCQKIEWLIWPPPLNLRAPWSPITALASSTNKNYLYKVSTLVSPVFQHLSVVLMETLKIYVQFNVILFFSWRSLNPPSISHPLLPHFLHFKSEFLQGIG